MAIRVRELTGEERAKVERLARSRAAPARLVGRARIIELAVEGQTAPAIARRLGIAEPAVRLWLRRFNAGGLAGLEDAPRSGRPPTYTESQRGRVIAAARALPPKPDSGEVPPTCHWTLGRLAAELNKQGLPIRRSQVRRILKAEHIRWQKPRTRLESDDPTFAEKRGPSSGSTSTRRPGARSCA